MLMAAEVRLEGCRWHINPFAAARQKMGDYMTLEQTGARAGSQSVYMIWCEYEGRDPNVTPCFHNPCSMGKMRAPVE